MTSHSVLQSVQIFRLSNFFWQIIPLFVACVLRKKCVTSQTKLNAFLFVLVFVEEKVVLGEAPFDDVHALTGSLKLYFRELPEPLIPYDFFSGFVTAISKFITFFKDGAYYCYCSYVLRISRYSDFLSPMLTNTGIFLRDLILSGVSRS